MIYNNVSKLKENLMNNFSLASIKEIFAPAFTLEKVVCRLIASWLTYSFITTFGRVNFFDLSFMKDVSLLSSLIIIFLIFTCYTAISALFKEYFTDSFLLLGFDTLCSLQWLFVYRSDEGQILFSLAVLLVYSLILFYFISKNKYLIEKIKVTKKAAVIFTACMGVFSFGAVAAVTCLRYKTFYSPNFDLGIFSQMFHYMKETGLPFVTTERDTFLSHFAVHISPIFYLLLPLYCIFPSPITLQIGQALIIASGIIPVLLLARHYKLSEKVTAVISLIYALYPALSCGAFYDIHENCFIAPLLLWMFYFFEEEKRVPMYVFAFAVLMVKEDAAVYLIIFAIYAMLSRKRYRQGGVILASSGVWFALSTFLIDRFGDGVMSDRYSNLIYNSEDGLWGAIKTAIQNPAYLISQLFSTDGADLSSSNFFFDSSTWAKVVYFLLLLLPLAFIPFCTKKMSRYLLIAPILLNLLTTYRYQYSILFQYNFAISAFLIYATIQNIPEIKSRIKPYLISFAAASCCILYMVTVVPKLAGYVAVYEDGKDMYAEMEQTLDTIPKDASVCASSVLIPHISDRKILYDANHHKNKPDVDFVVLDNRYNVESTVKAYESHGYEICFESEYILILKSPEAVYN